MNKGSFRNVLKKPEFVLLWLAQVFSQFSDKILFLFMVALITKEHFSNSAISILTLVFTIPAVIFGSFAGVFVDRFSKKKIMILTNFFRFIFVGMMLISFNEIYLYIMAFLVSTLTQFFAPAETSLIPEVVEKNDLIQANSLFTGTMLSSVVLGFALGAPFINKYDEKVTGFIIAFMYFISMILIFFINNKNESLNTQEKSNVSFFSEFKEGIAYVLKSKIILISMIRLVIIFSAFAALSVLVIGFVNDVLHIKPVYFGYMLATAGIGMGIGALFTSKTVTKIGKDKLISSGFLMTGIGLLILANTEYFTSLIFNQNYINAKIIFSFTFALITGFSAALCVIPLQTILQETAEENMRGKVFGVQNTLVNTAMTVPMALAGILADKLDKVFFNLKGVVVVICLTGFLVLLGTLLDLFLNKKQENISVSLENL